MKTNEILLRILLRGSPTNEDFIETVKNVPVLAEFSAGMLLSRNPTNKELLCIIAKAVEHRRQAWARLLKQHPTNDEIVQVIEGIHDLREEAWSQLLKQSPANSDLIRIVNRVPPLELAAWQLLTQRSLTEVELLTIYEHQCTAREPTIKTVVASALIGVSCQNATLVRIIRNEEGLREMTAELLLQRSPSNKDLREVVWFMNSVVRERICELLLQGEPSWADLECVARCSDGALGDGAAQRLLNYENEDGTQGTMACYAVLKRPAFADIAIKRLINNIDQGASNANFRAGALRNLYSGLDKDKVPESAQREAARAFLTAANRDDSGRSWQREMTEILEKHPGLENTSPSGSVSVSTKRPGRRSRITD